ncbi:MAG TPA: hypothetical protein VG734_13380 [Lacunisphaera sp.]|nr:hypothetical protein [Lacunisphaera sp.]
MPAIKIHLEHAEHDAVVRFAELLQVQPEDVAFSALNRLMLAAKEPAVQSDIKLTLSWRKDNLPLWADNAYSVHNYEGMSPVEPAKSRYSV